MSTEYSELEKELETLIKEEAKIHNRITEIMDKMQEILLKSSLENESQKIITSEEKIQKPQEENTQKTSTQKTEDKKEETDKTISKPKTRRKVQRKTVKAKTTEEKNE